MFDQYKGLRKELYVIVFGRVVTNMGAMVHAMMTLILNQKMGMSASEVALYLLIINLVSVPMNIVGGKLADKFNKRNMIIVCDIVSIVSYLICYFIELNYFSIFLISIAALFQQVERPTYDAMVADFSLPKDRSRAYSLSYLGTNLGFMLSPTIAGILFNKHLSLVFLISALSIAASTLLIFFLIKNTDKEESEEDVNEYENDLGEGKSIVKYLLSSKALVLYTLSFVAYAVAYRQYTYLLPLELTRIFKDSGSIIFGTANSLNCIECFVLTGVITGICRKKNDVTKMILGVVFGFASFVIYCVKPDNIFIIYFSMFVFTLGEILNSIGTRPYQSKRIPANYRGRFLSFIFIVENVAISLTQLIVGAIYDNFGYSAPWILIYIISLLSIILGIYLKFVDKKEYPNLY